MMHIYIGTFYSVLNTGVSSFQGWMSYLDHTFFGLLRLVHYVTLIIVALIVPVRLKHASQGN